MPNINYQKPLADRVRPSSLNDFLGQEEVIGENKLLGLAIEADKLPSIVLWGPLGSGKTTLSHIIGKQTKLEFLKLSAVSSGLKDLRDVVAKAEGFKK